VLEQRKTILKVLLSCVSSQKNKFTVLEKRKYCNGIFTEMVPTRSLASSQTSQLYNILASRTTQATQLTSPLTRHQPFSLPNQRK
jgi:hypothetical protein